MTNSSIDVIKMVYVIVFQERNNKCRHTWLHLTAVLNPLVTAFLHVCQQSEPRNNCIIHSERNN